MTNTAQHWSARPFVLFDGGDDKDVRAEVKVEKGFGKVSEVKVSDTNTVASVSFTMDNLKHPVSGWVNTNDDIFKVIQEHKESGEPLEYRIEQQRKANVDRTTPIRELSASMDLARMNTKRIIVGVKVAGELQLNSEALTDPKEDPTTPGAASKPKPATARKAPAVTTKPVAEKEEPVAVEHTEATLTSSPTTVTVATTSAPALAVNTEPVEAPNDFHDNSFFRSLNNGKPIAKEEAPWKTFNTDNRLNLGSGEFMSVVSSEQIARKILNATLEGAATSVDVLNLAREILHISDAVQRGMYDQKTHVDRSLASHTRSRGITYDTIESYNPLTKEIFVNEDSFSEWVSRTKNFAIERALLAITLFTEDNVTEVEENRSSTPSHEQTAAHNQTVFPDFIFKLENVEKREGPTATEETIAGLSDFAKEANFSRPQLVGLSRLIEHSLGHKLARECNDEDLGDFVDFYIDLGVEAFTEAVNWVLRATSPLVEGDEAHG